MEKQALEDKFHSDDEEEVSRYSRKIQTPQNTELNQSTPFSSHKNIFLDPPRQLSQRAYSLQPDMVSGWKPKNSKININNVFPIKYEQTVVDQIVKQLYKNKQKHSAKLVYLGPRRTNSYEFHEGRSYSNPYPSTKKQQQFTSGRPNMPMNTRIDDCYIHFNSDFEGGHLDVAILKGANEFDLFMRADSNTRGHTNWYFFEVENMQWVGTAKFCICNFRRQKSLYQRGLRPYVLSRLGKGPWKQAGKGVQYQKQRLIYDFLYDQDDSDEDGILDTFFSMSFEYQFTMPQDTVQFAYCIPYTYSQLIKFISTLNNVQMLSPLKTLSGLSVPVIQISDELEPDYNKKVVLVTARIHPGESNSSFVTQGFLEHLTSNEAQAKQLRKRYVVYVIPMLNPDGVVAGNYRTSLFGKDLNRTFNQSRKYAFPQIFFLLDLVKEIKIKHKQRFSLYIDLHGHSVKKNSFMYGPDFSIQHQNYEKSRQLPKLLASITSLFRYYSCIFRITDEKVSTGRAILNRRAQIPFTYTMQASNGFYYDSNFHCDQPFTASKWKQLGVNLCRALGLLRLDERRKLPQQFIKHVLKHSDSNQKNQEQRSYSHHSDDDIQQGNSDSQPSCQDLGEKQLQEIQQKIVVEGEPQNNVQKSPEKDSKFKPIQRQASKETHKKQKEKRSVFLPPINSQKRAVIFTNRNKKRQIFKEQRLKLVESQLELINQRANSSNERPQLNKQKNHSITDRTYFNNQSVVHYRNVMSQRDAFLKQELTTSFNLRKQTRKQLLMKLKNQNQNQT